MATAKKGTSTAKKKVELPVTEQVVSEAPVVESKKEAKKKEFKNSDGIKCTSITAGGLYMVGIKTDILYSWVDAGDTVEVEYQDLLAEVRTHGNYVFRPRFVIDDDDFIAEHPELDTLYASLYSKRDLRQILELPPEQIRKVVSGLPMGVKEALKGFAADAIDRHQFDSMNRIKVLDEVLGTQLLLKLNM